MGLGVPIAILLLPLVSATGTEVALVHLAGVGVGVVRLVRIRWCQEIRWCLEMRRGPEMRRRPEMSRRPDMTESPSTGLGGQSCVLCPDGLTIYREILCPHNTVMQS